MIDNEVRLIFVVKYMTISGTVSLVAGMFSATRSMKTEKASKTVIPSDTFSPESGGIRKVTRLRIDSHTQGIMILRTK